MTREDGLKLLEGANTDFDRDVDGAPVAANREEIAKWVKVLRENKYPQGEAQLYTPCQSDARKGSYCCLGVYCRDICAVPIIDFGEAQFPADIDVPLPLTYTAQKALAALNDGHNPNNRETGYVRPLPFSEIADVIEAVYL